MFGGGRVKSLTSVSKFLQVLQKNRAKKLVFTGVNGRNVNFSLLYRLFSNFLKDNKYGGCGKTQVEILGVTGTTLDLDVFVF